ncbi:MAG: hypothetical protein ACRD2R_00430 [Terriglobales bacterium]
MGPSSRCRWLVAAWLVLPLFLPAASLPGEAQAAASPSNPPQAASGAPAKKPRKVLTEDDLRQLRGTISVVGESPQPAGKAAGAKKPAEAEADSDILADTEEVAAEAERPPCVSWSWAAGVEAVLRAQGVNLDSMFWLMKSYGGEKCTDQLGNVASLAQAVQGDYTLDDGTRVRVDATVLGGFPDGNQMVSRHEQGIEYIVVWKGHPYVTSGYGGVKRVTQDRLGGTVMVEYVLETVDLVDPYQGRRVTFSRETDSLQEIGAVVQLVVTKR